MTKSRPAVSTLAPCGAGVAGQIGPAAFSLPAADLLVRWPRHRLPARSVAGRDF